MWRVEWTDESNSNVLIDTLLLPDRGSRAWEKERVELAGWVWPELRVGAGVGGDVEL
jgi:hypothetical protein